MPTMRLLRAVLPVRCLWTSLRDVEGLSFDVTGALKELYTVNGSDSDDGVELRLPVSSGAVPKAILSSKKVCTSFLYP